MLSLRVTHKYHPLTKPHPELCLCHALSQGHAWSLETPILLAHHSSPRSSLVPYSILTLLTFTHLLLSHYYFSSSLCLWSILASASCLPTPLPDLFLFIFHHQQPGSLGQEQIRPCHALVNSLQWLPVILAPSPDTTWTCFLDQPLQLPRSHRFSIPLASRSPWRPPPAPPPLPFPGMLCT